jgi:hypothetical protein
VEDWELVMQWAKERQIPLMAIGGASIPFASYATPITNKAMTNFVIPGASNYLRSGTNPGSVEIKDRGKMMMNNMMDYWGIKRWQ